MRAWSKAVTISSQNGTGRIVFMCRGINEVDEQTIPQILRNIALRAFNDLDAHFLVGSDDRLEFFWVKLFGESSQQSR